MHLTIIASDRVRAPNRTGSWVLRLAGTPELSETAPPDILSIVDKASAQVRSRFPEWLWQWVSSRGALDLEIFDGFVSWWWYTPLSEKSPLRSRLIREFYWLTLLRILFETYEITDADWLGEDRLIAAAAAKLAAQFRVNLHFHPTPGRRQPGIAHALVRRPIYSIFAMLRFLLVKAIFRGTSGDAVDFDAILYTRFPVLWERDGTTWRERMFGTWPDYLRAHECKPLYAAASSASLGDLVRQGRVLRERCRAQDISLFENRISFLALLRAHLTPRLFWRYLGWRRRMHTEPVEYDGFEVSDLFWREFDLGVLSSEIPFDLTIAAGIRAELTRQPAARVVFLPFEYQPMERAIWAGAKSVRDVAIVGLQTGLFESNQMGFSFPVQETKENLARDLKAPVPDMLAAYGELPYRVFVERLGEDRVCLSGPIRYSHLHKTAVSDNSLRRALQVDDSTVLILVATSIAREESVPLLEAAFKAAAERPEVFLLVKFHYHLPLHSELSEFAARCGLERYRLFDSDLYRLMDEARLTICAGSSVGIEAIAFDCMPVVFRSLGEMSSNPMLDVPDSVFFWHSISELQAALQSCLDQDEEYERRRSAWPRAIADHLFDLNVSPDERLYEFLRERAVL